VEKTTYLTQSHWQTLFQRWGV